MSVVILEKHSSVGLLISKPKEELFRHLTKFIVAGYILSFLIFFAYFFVSIKLRVLVMQLTRR